MDDEGFEYPSLEAVESDTAIIVEQMMEGVALQNDQIIEVVISNEMRKPLARVKVYFRKKVS